MKLCQSNQEIEQVLPKLRQLGILHGLPVFLEEIFESTAISILQNDSVLFQGHVFKGPQTFDDVGTPVAGLIINRLERVELVLPEVSRSDALIGLEDHDILIGVLLG